MDAVIMNFKTKLNTKTKTLYIDAFSRYLVMLITAECLLGQNKEHKLSTTF